jgi:hypothetical protein
VPILALEIISSLALDLQQSFFKIPMKNQTLNALGFQPYHSFMAYHLFFKMFYHKLFKYFKLANIASFHVSRCVKDFCNLFDIEAYSQMKSPKRLINKEALIITT